MAERLPRWFPVAGYAAGVCTLIFLMTLVVLSTMNVIVPTGGRWALAGVLSLGCALSFSFIGGDAAARGVLPFPFMNGSPIRVSLGGGAAFFFIVMLLAYFTYIKA
jgi:hypothetical protein